MEIPHDILIATGQAITIPMWFLMFAAPNWWLTKKITVPVAILPTLTIAMLYFMTEIPALGQVMFGQEVPPFSTAAGLQEFFSQSGIQKGGWLGIIALDLFTTMWTFHRLHAMKAKTWQISVMSFVGFIMPQLELLIFLLVVQPRMKKKNIERYGVAEPVQKELAWV